ncbi:MAG: radical SAM family heme chaperone HemW [Rubripirellula sp.]|nr:radical SAM family heme chaperone HemW [Rubripirellula sp.]
MALISDDRDDVSTPPGGWPVPRSAYIHVPFCRHRCGYCNFSVVANRDQWIDRYLQAIEVELTALDRPQVSTVFLGGGTPTHLSDDSLAKLLRLVASAFDTSADAEISVEANPEDINATTLAVLREHGVNRISLGVQSFDDSKLKILERGHSGDQARRIIDQAAAVVPNLSIDLIFSAPEETLATWNRDLEIACSLPIRHLSTYALTFEKGTQFWSRRHRGELFGNDDSLEVAMYQAARDRAREVGLLQYEVSSFAADGFRCRHNMSYWHGDGWFAAGPGAARFVNGLREVNHRSPATYLKRMENSQSPTAEREAISVEQFARERAAFGVRLLDGIELAEFESATGMDLLGLSADAIELSTSEGLIERQGSVIRLTERGILFADTVASRLLTADS